MANNSAKSFEDPTFREAVRKKVGKRFKGNLFEDGYDLLLLNIEIQVNYKVEIDEDKDIIEEAVSDSLDDLNQGDDYTVFALDTNRISDKRIAYTVLIRVGSAVNRDWPQGADLYRHIASFIEDEDIIAVSVKDFASHFSFKYFPL